MPANLPNESRHINCNRKVIKSMIQLTPTDLSIATLLIVALAITTSLLQLNIAKSILISASRTIIQLTLVGYVLKFIFTEASLLLIGCMSLVMLAIAGYESSSRQHRKFHGYWGFTLGSLSMFVSSFSLTFFTLITIINTDPWYAPQYSIPLLGMMLGNTLNGISLSLDRLTQNTWQQKDVIENRLMMGHTWQDAIKNIQVDSMKSGMTPTINSMSVAGIVSLPGMMTGQILAGANPLDAVKYQILIMLLITAGTGFGTITAVWFGSKRLFDERQRLRLDRLR